MSKQDQPNIPNDKLTQDGLLQYRSALELVLFVPVSALSNGITGTIGKYAYSFFNPAATQAMGGFGTFAGIGALAFPLAYIPTLISNHFLDKSSFLTEHSELKSFLKSSLGFVYSLAATAVAAAIIGSPIGTSVICTMVIPAMILGLATIVHSIGYALSRALTADADLHGGSAEDFSLCL